jgi:FkbM family methyltransferase
MAIKKILLKVLGEKRYLRFMSSTYQRLLGAGLLGKEARDVYFLKKLIRPGDYCADIGAHLGYFTLNLSKLVGPTGKVIAVEPMPPFHATLRQQLERRHTSNVTLYQVALGGDGDYVEMGIPDTSGSKHFAMARVIDANPHLHFSGSQKIKNEKGDRLFADLPRLDYVKCDVEGLEYQVFASMTATLQKHHPVLLCEFFDREMRIRFYELVKPFGYLPFALENGKLAPIDVYAEGQIIAQNDYFIPAEREEGLRSLIKGN